MSEVEGNYEHENWYWESEFAASDELPDMEVTVPSPLVKVQCALGDLALNYANTRLYTFNSDWKHLNHIYHMPESTAIYMFDSPEELMDELFEQEFKHIFSPFPEYMDLEAYHQYVRGEDPIEEVARKLYEGKHGEE